MLRGLQGFSFYLTFVIPALRELDAKITAAYEKEFIFERTRLINRETELLSSISPLLKADYASMSQLINEAYDFLDELGSESVTARALNEAMLQLQTGYATLVKSILRSGCDLQGELSGGSLIFDGFRASLHERLSAATLGKTSQALLNPLKALKA